MYHVIFVSLLFAFSLVMWNLVHSAPRSIAFYLSYRLCTVAGLIFLVGGSFAAFAASYSQNAEGLIASTVMAYVGLWFLLMRSVGERGSREDQTMVKRLFLMMALLLTTLVAVFYIGDRGFVILPNLALLAGGFWLTASFMRSLNSGR